MKGEVLVLAEQFDVFLLDLDGVVYLGEEPLAGAVESLRRLRQQGKAYLFVAVNRTSKFAFARLYRRATTLTTAAFLKALYSATNRIYSGVPVVEVSGELDLSTAPAFDEALNEAETVMDSIRRVVDLRGLTFMDASGLKVLMEHRNRLRNADRELRLVVPPREEWPVNRLLSLTGLDRVFPVYADLDSAVG